MFYKRAVLLLLFSSVSCAESNTNYLVGCWESDEQRSKLELEQTNNTGNKFYKCLSLGRCGNSFLEFSEEQYRSVLLGEGGVKHFFPYFDYKVDAQSLDETAVTYIDAGINDTLFFEGRDDFYVLVYDEYRDYYTRTKSKECREIKE